MKLTVASLFIFLSNVSYAQNVMLTECETATSAVGETGPTIGIFQDTADANLVKIVVANSDFYNTILLSSASKEEVSQLKNDKVADLFFDLNKTPGSSMPGGLLNAAHLVLKSGAGDLRYNPPIKGTLAVKGNIFLIMNCK